MTVEMRVLTVRQPWVAAIIHSGKDVENRVRNIAGNYRGLVAIHAAARVPSGAEIDRFCEQHSMAMYKITRGEGREAIFGAIIGVVDLVGVHVARAAASGRRVDWAEHTKPEELCSPWAEWDNWHLELANPRRLAVPMEWKGALGLRRLPAETARLVEELAVTHA